MAGGEPRGDRAGPLGCDAPQVTSASDFKVSMERWDHHHATADHGILYVRDLHVVLLLVESNRSKFRNWIITGLLINIVNIVNILPKSKAVKVGIEADLANEFPERNKEFVHGMKEAWRQAI